MLTQCPHCFTKVLLASDGICPACRKDARADKSPTQAMEEKDRFARPIDRIDPAGEPHQSRSGHKRRKIADWLRRERPRQEPQGRLHAGTKIGVELILAIVLCVSVCGAVACFLALRYSRLLHKLFPFLFE